MKKLMMLLAGAVFCAGVGFAEEPVAYLDWDGEKLVPVTCTDYEVVTNGANAFAASKTYVVKGEVSTANRIIVDGTVANPTRLILCDGAKLTASQGLKVVVNGSTTNALVICGQQGDTGVLDAKGVSGVAGIGGANSGAGGTVVINGGSVTATGGYHGAGIGGGAQGAGGTVMINGGIVTATGGFEGAGIGSGSGGGQVVAGGTVMINGGVVTATGGKYGAGIGGGWYGTGGTVVINGGVVTATGGTDGAGIGGGWYGTGGTVMFGEDFKGGVLAGDDAARATIMTADAYAKDHGAKYVTMPVAVLMIPMCEGCTCVVSNGVGEVEAVSTDGTNIYMVTRGDTVKVYFAPAANYRFVGDFTNPMDIGEITELVTVVDKTEFPPVELIPVDYLDWDGEKLVSATCTEYEIVTNGVSTFAAGKTYVVFGEVSTTSRIIVDGTVANPTRLILCDGAKLTASQGLKVVVNGSTTNALVICGQQGCTGVLDAKGVTGVAGIGGANSGAGGTVTINGGTVTATGDSYAAGIGGGPLGAGGTVMINGGIVTATGGFEGAGIGSGSGGGQVVAGGTVMINGGVVTATGGKYGAGIGGCYCGAGGAVEIRNGAVKSVGGEGASGIGHGAYSGDNGSISISGGIFAMPVEDGWLTEHSHVIDNPDPGTNADYPYQVVTLFRLTVPQVEHATVQVTTNGTVVAGFAGSVDVLLDSTVRVAFAAEQDYRIVANGEKEWTLTGDVTFGTTPGFPLPTIEGIPGTQLNPWQVGADVIAYTNANGVLTIAGTGAMDDFATPDAVPWDPETVVMVTVDAGVTYIGANALTRFANDVMINGIPVANYRLMATGFAPAPEPTPVPPAGAVTTWAALTNAVATYPTPTAPEGSATMGAESGAVIAVGADINEPDGVLTIAKEQAVTILLYGKVVSCQKVVVEGALTVGAEDDSVGKIVAAEGAKLSRTGSVVLLGGPIRGTFTSTTPGLAMMFR